MYDIIGPSEWSNLSLYELATWKNGLAFRDINFSATGKPVIKIAELKAGITEQTKFTEEIYDEKVYVRRHDLLFSWSGNPDTSIDVFRWDGPDGWLNQHIFKLYPNNYYVDDQFLFFLLKWLKPRFAAIARNKQTTGLGHVTVQDLKAMRVAIPSKDQQVAILSVIKPLQDRIDLNRRMNTTLDAMARSLFKDWFIDFGPVRTKMELQEPVGLSVEIVVLFPDTLNQGGIPVGWHTGSLADLCVLNPESWSKKNHPDAIQYVDLANTKRGTIESTTEFLWDDAPSRAQRILRPGDTIVGTVRPGNGSYAFISDDGLTGSTGFAVLRAHKPEYQEVVYLAATDPENIARLSHLADGGAYPAVRPDIVLNSPLVCAPDSIVAAFSGIVSPFMKKIEHNKVESRTLSQLRDLLLPKLMSGDLRLKDAEQLVSETL